MSMLWAVHCLDAPDAASRRQALRPAHSQRLRGPGPRPVLYGPLVSDDGQQPVGSLIVLEAETRDEVERFVESDPFATSRVWESVHIHAFDQSRNSPNKINR